MRLTQEIDYAFRMMGYLAAHDGEVIGAPIISDEMKVPERFALRILRKLNQAGLTGAKRGAHGGYYLKANKEDLTLYDVILAIDGPIVINRCLHAQDGFCSRNEDGDYTGCKFHFRLAEIQGQVIEMFKDSKIIDLY